MGMRWRPATVILAALFSASCTGTDEPFSDPAGTSPKSQAISTGDVGWSLDGVRVDRIPRDPAYARTHLPRRFPADVATPTNLLADPPGRALLTYHPREFYEPGGWVTERIFLLGADGAWRTLNLVDLGLPESSWPGIDTYGAGELSYDGRVWAGPTNDGAVLVDLATGRSWFVALPGSHTHYLAWLPDGRQLNVARLSGLRTLRTWSVNVRTGEINRAPYLLPLSPAAADGTVVTFTKSERGTHRITRRSDGTSRSESVSVPFKHVRYGALAGPTHTLIGLPRSSAAVDNTSASTPLARLAAPVHALGWLDEDRVLLSLDRLGILTWHVGTGKVELLTRVRPATQPDSWWSVAVALNLLR